MSRRRLERACARSFGHATHADAEAYRFALALMPSLTRLVSYRCPLCQQWHVAGRSILRSLP